MAKYVKSGAPTNLRRFTVQVDDDLFTMIKSIAVSCQINTYVAVNMLFILGIEDFLNRVRNNKDIEQSVNIALKQKSLTTIRNMVKEIVNTTLEANVLW